MSSPTILDGKKMAAEIRREVVEAVKALPAPPALAVILVGDDAASQVYVSHKEKDAQEVGFRSILERYPSTITENFLLDRIAQLNADPTVHGFFVQLPLPKHVDADKVTRAIAPEKDVDGFHPVNQGLLLLGQPRFVPATPRGVLEMLRRSGHETAGKRIVVVGRSSIVGKPLAAALMMKGAMGDATVTVAHSRTPHLAAVCREADILIAAIGAPRFITRDFVKPGAVVIDVGMNRVDGKLCGDVDYEQVLEVASAITPVPGGVGPMTRAMLLLNTLDAARAQMGVSDK